VDQRWAIMGPNKKMAIKRGRHLSAPWVARAKSVPWITRADRSRVWVYVPTCAVVIVLSPVWVCLIMPADVAAI
jgi:hypothetical protein